MEKSYKTSKHNLKSYNLNIINDFTDAFNWLINTVCHNLIFDYFYFNYYYYYFIYWKG
jgi:hypothetical protein